MHQSEKYLSKSKVPDVKTRALVTSQFSVPYKRVPSFCAGFPFGGRPLSPLRAPRPPLSEVTARRHGYLLVNCPGCSDQSVSFSRICEHTVYAITYQLPGAGEGHGISSLPPWLMHFDKVDVGHSRSYPPTPAFGRHPLTGRHRIASHPSSVPFPKESHLT